MKIRSLLFCLSSSLIFLPPAYPQGSLTPSGSPGPTMKTLDQLDSKMEKRTPITSTTGPFNITSSGSYYLTRNIGYGDNGLVITADDVTVDLNGFSLLGPGTGTGNGILVSGSHKNITIRNGEVHGFGAHGISAITTDNVVVEHVTVSDNGAAPATGMVLGNHARVTECSATGNGNGIYVAADSIVSRCSATGNTGSGIVSSSSGSLIEDCTASRNAVYGFAVTSDATIVHCVAFGNGSRGITATAGCTITDCVVTSNGTYGIYTENDAVVSKCVARKQSIGIRVGDNATITGCTANENTADGIQAVNGCLIMNNIASFNGTLNGGGTGIHLLGTENRVDGNHVLRSLGVPTTPALSVGIRSNGGPGADYVVRNMARGSQLNYDPGSGTTMAPQQPPSTATSPWANLQ
jgi:hypothetical protein